MFLILLTFLTLSFDAMSNNNNDNNDNNNNNNNNKKKKKKKKKVYPFGVSKDS